MPPTEIVEMIHETWKRFRHSVSSELFSRMRVSAIGIPKRKASFLDPSATVEDARAETFTFTLRWVAPTFEGFPWSYEVRAHDVLVESGPCPTGFKPNRDQY